MDTNVKARYCVYTLYGRSVCLSVVCGHVCTGKTQEQMNLDFDVAMWSRLDRVSL